MADSDTDLCNLALRKLREQPIAALTQDREAARLCNQFYADARDHLLALHPSNFAMARQRLGQNAAPPAFGWRYGYSLPTDPYCLKAVKVYRNGAYHERFAVEGRDLLCDLDNDVHLLYVARVTDVVSFPPTFVNALATFLACKLSFALTRDKKLEAQMEARFRKDWREHRAVDGSEGWHDDFEDGVFVRARG